MLELTLTLRAFPRQREPDGKFSAPVIRVSADGAPDFLIDARNIGGKLGAMLDRLVHDAGIEERGTAQNCHTAQAPWDESLIRVVAPGRAYGVNGAAERAKRDAAKREVQRVVQELSLEELGL